MSSQKKYIDIAKELDVLNSLFIDPKPKAPFRLCGLGLKDCLNKVKEGDSATWCRGLNN